MEIFNEKIRDEKGSVLIVALLILVLLTIIGISATTNTEIDTRIAGNAKFHKMAFFNADSGIFPTAKLISQIVNDQSVPSGLSNITYLQDTDGTKFLNQILGYDTYTNSPDIKINLGSFDTEVDVDRTGSKNIVGGGTEFAAGAEGIGSGSGGGVAIYYTIDSKGSGPSNSSSEISSDYRKVVGVPGGL